MTALVTTIAELRAALAHQRASGATIGFVPTMGYLHDGHASLIRAAVAECAWTFVSVFVNPLQFAPTDDLAAYPRDLDRDVAVAAREGAALVFAPAVEEMYPRPMATSVRVEGLTRPLEGEFRPGHFDGVTTVVAKLFGLAGPCRAYFGEKDWQQLAVIRRMVADLSMPVAVVGCPTVREPDGLALSSRNVYLSEDERRVAPVLHRSLQEARAAILAGERDPAVVRTLMQRRIDDSPARVDYVAVVDADTLDVVDPLAGEVRLLVAARLGTARLIDNIGVTVP